MKDIKDYIHLYIGGKVSVTNLEGRVVVLLDYDFLHSYYDEDNGEFLNDPKPILRRLSDMSEEEAIALCKLQTPEKRWADVDVHDISHCDIHFTDGSKWYGDGVEEMNDLHVHFERLNANQFAYLLSKSFDLFALINSGLAIDAKTLTN